MGDVVNCSVRRYGNWGLMPFGAMMGSVVPATYMRGRRETYNEYEQVRGPWPSFGKDWLHFAASATDFVSCVGCNRPAAMLRRTTGREST